MCVARCVRSWVVFISWVTALLCRYSNDRFFLISYLVCCVCCIQRQPGEERVCWRVIVSVDRERVSESRWSSQIFFCFAHLTVAADSDDGVSIRGIFASICQIHFESLQIRRPKPAQLNTIAFLLLFANEGGSGAFSLNYLSATFCVSVLVCADLLQMYWLRCYELPLCGHDCLIYYHD